VLARPPGEPVVETVRRHTLGVAERMNLLPAERRNAFRRLVANVPSVHLRMRELSARTEDELARILAVETGKPATDPIARMVASVLGVLTRLAFGVVGGEAKRWNHASIIASIHEGFDLLSQGLGSAPMEPGSPDEGSCFPIENLPATPWIFETPIVLTTAAWNRHAPRGK